MQYRGKQLIEVVGKHFSLNTMAAKEEGMKADIESSEKSSIYYNMIGSMTSGLISRMPCHPLDTCKAKLQVQQSSLKDVSNAALKEISTSDPHVQSRYLPKIRQIPGIGTLIAGNPGSVPPQTQPFTNTLDVLTRTVEREGIAGLYRGILMFCDHRFTLFCQ